MFHRLGGALLKAALAAVFITSLTALATLGLEYRQAAGEYAHAEALAGLSFPPAGVGSGEVGPGSTSPVPDGAAPPADRADIPEGPDLTALRAVNPDVAFWLLIPDTPVSYPAVQGTDNSFYLDHTWTGRQNRGGSIFLDHRCSAVLDGFHTVIYGHHMRDGSMFAALAGYADQAFLEAHPVFYLLTDRGRVRCEVFAACEVEATDGAYRLDFAGDGDRESFLEECLAGSVIDAGIIPTVRDRILTLSTCTAAGSRRTRWVVRAVLYEEG